MTNEPLAPPTSENIRGDMADTRQHLSAHVQAFGDRFMGSGG